MTPPDDIATLRALVVPPSMDFVLAVAGALMSFAVAFHQGEAGNLLAAAAWLASCGVWVWNCLSEEGP
jgi:hypothetical protein